MKHLLLGIVLFSVAILFSCSNNNDDTQTASQNSTSLEGVWKLQNISTGAKLTFQGQNWKLNSGTVEMSGTFTLVGSLMSGQVLNRSGQGSNLIQPDSFTGNFEIENNKVTFTNFNGNWFAPFSSWYQKQ
ncbi:MAG TPA: hypothetical protein VF677_03405 [Flavobacterium sp.]